MKSPDASFRKRDGKRRSQRVARPAVVLIVTMLGILLLGLVVGSLLQSVTLGSRHNRLREDYQQAYWLAESAIQRAESQLQKEPGYEGETWKIAAPQLGGEPGRVVIQVTDSPPNASSRNASSPKTKQIKVSAAYPADSPREVTFSQISSYRLPAAGGSP